jgi:hypothetical protein
MSADGFTLALGRRAVTRNGRPATFPTAGAYRLFLQFKVDGAVHTAAFTQEVSS